MIAGKLNAHHRVQSFVRTSLMTSVTEVVAGRPIPKRIVVEEAMFTMDTAKQFIQTRKY
jgi:simple sugar transport system substrate-binding protein